jgi:hypothetical protein
VRAGGEELLLGGDRGLGAVALVHQRPLDLARALHGRDLLAHVADYVHHELIGREQG